MTCTSYKFLLLVSLLVYSFIAVGQTTVTNKGERVFILPGNNIYIKGSYVNDVAGPVANDDPQLVNNGSIFFSGDIINNSAVNIVDNDAQGVIELNGSTTQQLGGTSTLNVYKLNINKTGDLQLLKNIEVTDQITFISGLINLNGYNIDLGSTGSLVNESNSNRIYGTGAGTINYTIPATPTLSDPLNGIGVRLEGTISANTKVRRGHNVQSTAGDGSIGRYFDLELNSGEEIQALRFYYFDAEIPGGFNEADLVLYVSYDGGTVWQKFGGTINTSLNTVELTNLNITSNVRVSLAEKDCNTPPLVDLGPATKDFCTGEVVTLNAGNPGAFYEWSTTEATQIITTSITGNYAVTVRDAKGCEGMDNITLTERPVPVADFSSGIACPTQAVNFTNTSTIASGTLTHSWDFGDPSTTSDNSTQQNPSYAYPIANDYLIRLAVKSQYNCVDTLEKSVTVYPFPQTDFSFTNACLGQTTNFTNTSTIPIGGMTYLWDFGDATTSTQINPSKNFPSIASNTVSLTATSNAGCVKAISKTVDVNHTPLADFSVSNACEQSIISITNSSTITTGTLSYNWDFGDATTATGAVPVKSYASAGSYTIALTATSGFGCSNSVSKPISIYQNPVSSFSVGDDCKDKIFNFNNSSSSGQGTLTYFWDFDDGNTSTAQNPSRTFASAGSYNVFLEATTSFGCTNIYTQSLNVFPLPLTDFIVNNACQDASFPFTNLSTLSSGALTFDWDFDDGQTSTLTNPSINFALSGSYDVLLTATSDKGCVKSRTKALDVFAMPVVNFGGSINTCGTSYVLDAENTGSTYLWSDGSTNQTFTVTQDGTYSVTITTQNSCSVFESVDIVLQGDVTPNLGSDQVACGDFMLDAGYPGSTYAWSTGETTRSILATSTGNYSVTVTDPNGCIGADQVFITVNPKPTVNLGLDRSVCSTQQVVLDAGNPGTTYLWSDNSTNRTLQVNATGVYYVESRNSFGCFDRDTVSIIVNPSPINNLPASINGCDVVELDAGSSGSSYLWSTGSTNQKINVNSSGTYSVTVTTSANCTLQFSTNVTINPGYFVNLGSDQSLCFGQSAFLDAGNSGDSYRWSNGFTGKTLIASQAGIYWVDVRKNNGCIKRDSIEVEIFPAIVNNLKSSYDLCTNESRTLDATSLQGIDYSWFTKNGLISNNPIITVSEPEKYWVKTTGAGNCTVTDTVSVKIDADPIAARFLVATFVDVGDSVKFVQLSYPDPIAFDWDFADGITSTGSDPVHIYLRPGDFDASLLVTDPNGCRDSKSKIITVRLLRTEGELEVELPFVEILSSSVYPNPASDVLNVDFELNKEVEIRIFLYSIDGKIIDSKTAKFKDDTVEFNVRSLRAGTYILRVFINNDEKTMRIIKI